MTGLRTLSFPEGVGLYWTETAGATSYEIYRRAPDGTYPAAPIGTTTGNNFVDGGRTPGQKYCYKVAATNNGMVGPLSEEACGIASPPAGGPGGGPAPPGPGSPPFVDLSGLPQVVTVGRRGTFTLALDGSPGRTGSISLTSVRAVAAGRSKRKLRLAREPFTVAADGSARVRFKLRPRHLKVLRRQRRLAVSVRATLRQVSAARRITLRGPRARRAAR